MSRNTESGWLSLPRLLLLSAVEFCHRVDSRLETMADSVVSLQLDVEKAETAVPDLVPLVGAKLAEGMSVVLQEAVSGGGVGSSVQVVSHGIAPVVFVQGYSGVAAAEPEFTPVPPVKPLGLADGTPVTEMDSVMFPLIGLTDMVEVILGSDVIPGAAEADVELAVPGANERDCDVSIGRGPVVDRGLVTPAHELEFENGEGAAADVAIGEPAVAVHHVELGNV